MIGSWLERYGLWFADPALERAFKEEYVLRHIPIYQVVIFIAGFATYSFVLWDRAIDPVNWRFGQSIRLYVMIPTLWLTAAILWIRPARKYMEWLISVSGIVSTTSLAVIYLNLQRGFDFGAVGPIIVGGGCSRSSSCGSCTRSYSCWDRPSPSSASRCSWARRGPRR